MSDRAFRIGSLVVGGLALVYATYILVFSAQYTFEGRMFPVAIAVLTIVVAIAFIKNSLMEGRPTATDPAHGTGGDREPADADHAYVPDDRDVAIGGDDPGGEHADAEARSPSPDVDVRALIAVVGGSLVVFTIAGVYPFAFVLPVLFVRFLGKHSWKVAVLSGLALLVFAYAIIDRLVQVAVDEWGLIDRFL